MHDDAYIGGHSENNIKCVMHDDLGWKNQTTRCILPRHWLYEWFSQFHRCGTYSVLSRSHSVAAAGLRVQVWMTQYIHHNIIVLGKLLRIAGVWFLKAKCPPPQCRAKVVKTLTAQNDVVCMQVTTAGFTTQIKFPASRRLHPMSCNIPWPSWPY